METIQKLITRLRKENEAKIKVTKTAISKELAQPFMLCLSIDLSKCLVKLHKELMMAYAEQSIYDELVTEENKLNFLQTELNTLVNSKYCHNDTGTQVLMYETKIKLVKSLISLF